MKLASALPTACITHVPCCTAPRVTGYPRPIVVRHFDKELLSARSSVPVQVSDRGFDFATMLLIAAHPAAVPVSARQINRAAIVRGFPFTTTERRLKLFRFLWKTEKEKFKTDNAAAVSVSPNFRALYARARFLQSTIFVASRVSAARKSYRSLYGI